MKFKFLNLIYLGLILIIANGCNGSSEPKTSNTLSKIAAAKGPIISGLEIKCDDDLSLTNPSGKFTYKTACQQVEFKIGNIALGTIFTKEINSDKVIYPADILKIDRKNTTDVRLRDMIQFLQSLDSDNTLDNGINITQEKRDLLASKSFNFQDKSLSFSDFKKDLGFKLTDKIKAVTYYEQALNNDLGFSINTVPPMVPNFEK